MRYCGPTHRIPPNDACCYTGAHECLQQEQLKLVQFRVNDGMPSLSTAKIVGTQPNKLPCIHGLCSSCTECWQGCIVLLLVLAVQCSCPARCCVAAALVLLELAVGMAACSTGMDGPHMTQQYASTHCIIHTSRQCSPHSVALAIPAPWTTHKKAAATQQLAQWQ